MAIRLVDNYKKGLKWFSTWAFALIVFLGTTPLPPELLSLLPDGAKDKVLAMVALCGLVLRFIAQDKPNKNPPIKASSNNIKATAGPLLFNSDNHSRDKNSDIEPVIAMHALVSHHTRTYDNYECQGHNPYGSDYSSYDSCSSSGGSYD